MAYENLGQSFMPRFEGDDASAGSARLDDVLRVLSFRLPRILGGKPIAPRALLESKGSAADPLANAIVNSVLSTVLKGSPEVTAPDVGAPSPFSKLLAPIFGSPTRAPQSPAELPPPPKPSIHFIDKPEPPAPQPPTGTIEGVRRQPRHAGRRIL